MTPCLDHQPTRDANGKPRPAVTGKHYNYAQRKNMEAKRKVLDRWAAELRRIVGTPEIRRITSSVVASSVDRVGELSGVLCTSGGQDQEHRCAARIRGLRLIGFLRAPLHPEELPRDHVAYFRLNTCVHHAC